MTLPAIFFGHGSPMNAIERNPYTDAWRAIGTAFPRPRAIVAISAHWTTRGTRVTAMAQPRTIHDFGGFPAALHALRYPAPGDPALARRIAGLLAPLPVALDEEWGLDHGTWSVLAHVYPDASIPVVQVSVDETQPPASLQQIGRALAPLRDEGILVMGSGNVVHDLRAFMRARPDDAPAAAAAEAQIAGVLAAGDDAAIAALASTPVVAGVVPDDHLFPVLAIAAARRGAEGVSFFVRGTMPGISMLSMRVG